MTAVYARRIDQNLKIKLNMKTTLLFAGLITLFITSGCVVDDGHRDHHRDAVIVAPAPPPAVVVRPPEVIVR